MRWFTTSCTILIGIAASGCSAVGSPDAPDAALEHDLRLASTATLDLAPASQGVVGELETAPVERPDEVRQSRPRAAASGPRRVASSIPSVPLAVAPEPPEEEVLSGESEVSSSAEAREAAEAEVEGEIIAIDGVALPRPVPVGAGLPPVDDGYGRPRGPSAGDVIGGAIGAVIRGGDIDDCRIHDRRGRRPVYRPGSPGVGSGRWPVARPPQTRTGNGGEGRAGVGGRRWPTRAGQ